MRTILLLAFMALGMGIGGCDGDDGGTGGGGGGTGGSGSGGNGGSGTGGGSSACFDYTGFDGSSPAVSLRADVMPVLQTSCTFAASCHGAESGSAGGFYLGPSMGTSPTDMQIQALLAQTVGADPAIAAGMPRITASDPAQSFLMHKMDGTVGCADLACAAGASCGQTMPPAQPIIAQDRRDTVRRWIAQGAQDN